MENVGRLWVRIDEFLTTVGTGRVARKKPFATGPKSGVFATVEEIAAAEKINVSYVGRVLRLTLLAPNIVDAILDGRQPAAMTLAVLMRTFAVGWDRQSAMGFSSGALMIE